MTTIRQSVKPAPDEYVSGKKKLTRSVQHEGWLVDGHLIKTDDITILKMYPPNK